MPNGINTYLYEPKLSIYHSERRQPKLKMNISSLLPMILLNRTPKKLVYPLPLNKIKNTYISKIETP